MLKTGFTVTIATINTLHPKQYPTYTLDKAHWTKDNGLRKQNKTWAKYIYSKIHLTGPWHIQIFLDILFQSLFWFSDDIQLVEHSSENCYYANS